MPKYKVTVEHRLYQDVEVEARDAYEAEDIAVETPITEENLQSGFEAEIISTECLTSLKECLASMINKRKLIKPQHKE